MKRFVPALRQRRLVCAGVGPHLIECLEPRRLFAAVSWDGGGDGSSWNDPNNWSGDSTPADNDNVTIAAGSPTIVLSGASEQVATLTCSRQLAISGTLLTVTSSATLNALSAIFGGGGLSLGGTCTVNAPLILGSASDNSIGDLYFTSSSAQALAGTGNIQAVGNDTSYLINAGASTLTIPAGFNVVGKNLSIFAATPTVTIVNNGIISASGAGGTCSVDDIPTSAGTMQAINGGTMTTVSSLTSTGPINVGANSKFVVNGTFASWNTLTVAGVLRVPNNQLRIENGTAVATVGSNAVIVAGSVFVGGGRQLNLNDNDMIVDYTGTSALGSWSGSAYTGLTGMIQQGRNGGSWTGSGIVTGMTAAKDPNTLTNLGIAEASQVLGLSGTQTTLWDGQTVDATTVLIKYTYNGDANLDGAVTGDDYFQIDSSFPQHLRGFANGDFNYDGAITGDDYFLIDSTFPAQKSPL